MALAERYENQAVDNIQNKKIICYLLNGQRDYNKEEKMAKLFSDILTEISIVEK